MRRLAPFAVAILFAACDTPFTPEAVAGTYRLVSISGNALPYTLTDSGTTYTITDGSIILTEASTFTWTTTVTATESGSTSTFTDSSTGTYTLADPSTITLQVTSGLHLVLAGTLEGDRFTLEGDDDTLVFEK